MIKQFQQMDLFTSEITALTNTLTMSMKRLSLNLSAKQRNDIEDVHVQIVNQQISHIVNPLVDAMVR